MKKGVNNRYKKKKCKKVIWPKKYRVIKPRRAILCEVEVFDIFDIEDDPWI